MTDPLPLEQMSFEEREAVLKNVARNLHISASIAQGDGDPVWKLLLALAYRLEGSRDLAKDPKRADDVIQKAVRLLSEFERRRPRGSVH